MGWWDGGLSSLRIGTCKSLNKGHAQRTSNTEFIEAYPPVRIFACFSIAAERIEQAGDNVCVCMCVCLCVQNVYVCIYTMCVCSRAKVVC